MKTMLVLLSFSAQGYISLEVPYLINILAENIKRYEQLKEMIQQGENTEQLLRILNEGIGNASGLLSTLPIDSSNTLSDLSQLQDISRDVQKIYGTIPKGKEGSLFRRHDLTTSEGLRMAAQSKEYAKRQEHNAQRVFNQATGASQVGAQRMTAQMSAQILHVLNQLLRVNTQILKLQSEDFAFENKKGKNAVRHFNHLSHEMKRASQKFEVSRQFPRFR